MILRLWLAVLLLLVIGMVGFAVSPPFLYIIGTLAGFFLGTGFATWAFQCSLRQRGYSEAEIRKIFGG